MILMLRFMKTLSLGRSVLILLHILHEVESKVVFIGPCWGISMSFESIKELRLDGCGESCECKSDREAVHCLVYKVMF